jgi:hypothetical protein
VLFAKESIATAKPNPNEMLSNKEVIKIFVTVMTPGKIKITEHITPANVQHKRNKFILTI